jgi:hypothetical protein
MLLGKERIFHVSLLLAGQTFVYAVVNFPQINNAILRLAQLLLKIARFVLEIFGTLSTREEIVDKITDTFDELNCVVYFYI